MAARVRVLGDDEAASARTRRAGAATRAYHGRHAHRHAAESGCTLRALFAADCPPADEVRMVQAALAIQAEFLRHYIARVFGRGTVPMQRNLSVPKANQSCSNHQRMRAPYTRVLQQPPRDSVACALHNDGRRWMKPARRAVCDPRDPFRRAPRRCHPLGPCVAHALPLLALRTHARTHSMHSATKLQCAFGSVLRRHLGKVYLPPPAQESFAHNC